MPSVWLLPVLLSWAAAAAPEPPLGYVVKVESGTVYLDFGDKTGAAPGRPFQVYVEGEELKHPVGGRSLGRVETSVAEGRLTHVLPQYSMGTLLQGGAPVKAGMRARLGERVEAAPPAPPAAKPVEKTGLSGREPRWKSPALDMTVVALAAADFRGDGKTALALADKKTIGLYAYPPKQLQPLAQFVLPGVGPRVLGLTAADVNGNGRAELFVTYYNETFERAETTVLEWTDGQWKALADIPWLVRAYQDGSGRAIPAMQQLLADQSFPFSSVYALTWSDGKYVRGEPVRHKRVEFLYDFTLATLEPGKDPALLLVTPNGRLRVQFAKGFWRTPEAYGQTPTRLRWHGRLLEFHPSSPVLYEKGQAGVFLVKNASALGSLSEPFGLFNGGAIERHGWTGVALAPQWRAELGGYAAALQLVPGEAGPELAVAVAGTGGQSAVWVFDP